MKKLLFICGLIAALLCLSQSANAQYARKGANLVNQNGMVLSDQEIINLVGNDIYEQTYVGARKQFKVGSGLIWGGAAGTLVGVAGMAVGMYAFGANLREDSHGNITFNNEEEAGIGAVMMTAGYVLTALGGTALTIGIPLNIIGKSRLNWVEEQANAAKGYSVNFGATPNGAGLVVRF